MTELKTMAQYKREIDHMSDLEKLKIYMDYYITILSLNAHIELDMLEVCIHNIQSFEEFIADTTDHRISETILGWYSRFEERLIKKWDLNVKNTKQRQQLFS